MNGMIILDKFSRLFFKKRTSDILKEGVVENIAYASNICLNCGTQLVGKYCHNCGQVVSPKEPNYKFSNFLISYFSRIYLWHPKIPFTLWTLFTKPGFLINEYLAGKHTTYTDPLVLNRFFLLVITTLFGFFSVFEEHETILENTLTDKRFIAENALSLVAENEEYQQIMADSPRDTVRLNTFLAVIANYPALVEPMDTLVDMKGKASDTLLASVPSVWIKDSILVGNQQTGYSFSLKSQVFNNEISTDQIIAVWRKMVDLSRKNIGLIVLLICPIIAFVIRVVHKNERMHMHYFIFSLYYTGVVEVVMLLAFLMTLLFSVPYKFLEWVILVFLLGYLTVALKKAFNQNSWFVACLKAVFVNLVYLMVILLAMLIILLIAVVWILL